jgi:glutaredoxin
MRKTALLPALLCAAVMAPAQAQTAYRWVDNEGKVHYGDRPPPPKAAREVQERKYSAPAADRAPSFALRQAQQNFPVALYVGADCPACQEGRDYLKKRGIPFEEKLVASNEEIDALRARLGGGEVMVPSLQVGEKISKGFLAPAWGGLLDAAGYPKAP